MTGNRLGKRTISRGLPTGPVPFPRTLKLNSAMAIIFVCLSLPVLLFIMIYNYHRNSVATSAALDQAVASTLQITIENAQGFMRPVASTLQVLAGIAGANPQFFRTAESADLLYRSLISADQIDAIYVSFEDGYHRVVTRIDDDRRRSDPRIPSSARWHSSYIDDFSAGDARARHRTFSDTWPNVVGSYSIPTTMDIRRLKGYPEAKALLSLVVTEPDINPDTGYPVIFLRFPVVRSGEFIGAATANITMDVLSHFLAGHRASARSKAIVADPTDGKIIAASERERGVQLVDGVLRVATLTSNDDGDVREAGRIQAQTGRARFLFDSPVDGEEISAAFATVPGIAGHEWQVVVLTPTDDFVGALKANSRHMVAVIAGLTMAELLFIVVLAARLSYPIESISRELRAVEALSFDDPPIPPSPLRIKEIAQLQSTASLLRNSLKSFSSFVPLDVVRELVRSGHPLTLGVEPRLLTVFFSDLEDFSRRAEQLAPNELLEQMSVYFEEVTGAIVQEHGTVDKFIGDGVMAFWGAPVPRADHALRACVGALRAARRMERTNERWRTQGRPIFRIRVGLHSGEVLVGNVGSSDRLSYTAMGDGVNVAARLEGMNKRFGTTICISDMVVEACGPDLVVRPLRQVRVRGRAGEFMVYELLGIDGSDDPELRARPEDVTRARMTWEAAGHFGRGDLARAASRYRAILDEFPGDPAAEVLLADCTASPSTADRSEA